LEGEKNKTSFLKKRSKKFLLLRCFNLTLRTSPCADANEPEFFGSFFQKITLTAVRRLLHKSVAICSLSVLSCLNQQTAGVTLSDLVTLYHSPNTRSSGALTLLEELGVPFTLHTLNMKAGEQRQPAFLAVNPMGKVPALLHRGELITEQPAVFLYLADLYPQAGLAPAIDSALRGPYLRLMVFYGSCFEPAVIDRAMKREPGSPAMSPYGDFDSTLAIVTARLRAGPYLLGDQFSAADVLWGLALSWMTSFKLVPESPEVTDYVARVTSRPAFVRVRERDAALAAEHARAVAA